MSKRKKRSSRASSRAPRSVSSEKSQAPPSAAVAETDSSSPQEYEYVSKDLRQVGILAAALFALLFALSFFIG